MSVKYEDGSDCPKTEKLPAYTMNLIHFDHGNHDLHEAGCICDAFEDMEPVGKLFVGVGTGLAIQSGSEFLLAVRITSS